MKSTIEKIDLRLCLDKINPRQRSSYNLKQMAEWIQAKGFRLINKPVVARITDDFLLQKYGMALKEFLTLQGHQRIYAIVQEILENHAHYGLTQEEAEALCFQEVEVMEGLMEEECKDIAYDEKYRTGLLRWEIVLKVKELDDQGFDNFDIAEIVGHDICKNHMVGKGPAIWTTFCGMRVYKEKRKFLGDKCGNVIKHCKYANALGPWIFELLQKHFKYLKDGVEMPEDTFVAFNADWQRVNRLYSVYFNTKDSEDDKWEGPITDVNFDGENKYVKDVVGGNKAVATEIGIIIKELVDGIEEGKKAPTKKRQREIADKLVDGDLKSLTESLLVTGDFTLIPEIDNRLRRDKAVFAKLREVLSNVPEMLRPLLDATLADRDPEKVAKLWLEFSVPEPKEKVPTKSRK